MIVRPVSMTSTVAATISGVGVECNTGDDPLVGIEVNLPRHCPCGNDMLHVGPGRNPHCASLHCARCQHHCGWISNEVAKFLCDVITHFGRPTEPVRVRLAKSSLSSSAPPGADAV
jgi:hypothetical protein